MGFIYSIQICEISHQTFGPSHWTCPMIFVNTVSASYMSYTCHDSSAVESLTNLSMQNMWKIQELLNISIYKRIWPEVRFSFHNTSWLHYKFCCPTSVWTDHHEVIQKRHPGDERKKFMNDISFYCSWCQRACWVALLVSQKFSQQVLSSPISIVLTLWRLLYIYSR